MEKIECKQENNWQSVGIERRKEHRLLYLLILSM